jgi:hypothetical protein
MRRSELARVRDLEASVAAQERQIGADDPRTIESRLRLVEAYEQLPDYEDDSQPWEDLAITELAKAVDGRVRTLGPDHPDTLTIRYQLAFLRFQVVLMDFSERGADGRAELMPELRAIADDAERVLGPTHPDTLGYWGMLSRHCPEAERPGLEERVVRGWEQVRAEREQRLGPDDPEALDVVLLLAGRYQDDRPEEAQRLRERTAAGWGRVAAERTRRLGPVHPDTVAARERHIGLHTAWVSPDDDDRLYQELVTDHERLLGPDHPRTLHAQLELLQRRNLTSDPTPEAISAAERLIDRIRAVLGPDHKDFRTLRYRLMVAHVMLTGSRDVAGEIERRYPSPSDDDFFRWESPDT